jgi:hypothetical protein
LREKRGIIAERQMPPSGPEVSGLVFPDDPSEKGQDFFQYYDEWVADLWEVEERCVPARLRDAAEWSHFISVCALFDPPVDQDQLDVFARRGDPTFLDYGRPGGKGDRAPMKAAAPIRRMVSDEKEIEEVYLWLLDRLLEELGERYLAPIGIDVDEAIKEIIDSTGLNNQCHKKTL